MQRVDASYIDEVAREGFAILEDVLDAHTVESLIKGELRRIRRRWDATT
jgi:hypothetical protein